MLYILPDALCLWPNQHENHSRALSTAITPHRRPKAVVKSETQQSDKMCKLGNRELNALYQGLWDSELNANIRNIRTGNIGPTHHCSICDKRAVINCYRQMHFAFCIAAVTDKNGVSHICGERFCPKSPTGCATHPYNHGYNEIIKDHWKNIKSIGEALEEIELAKKAQQLSLEAKEDKVKPDLSYEQWNQMNKEKELTAKRDRREARTMAATALITKAKGNAGKGTKMDTKFATKNAKKAAKAAKNASLNG